MPDTPQKNTPPSSDDVTPPKDSKGGKGPAAGGAYSTLQNAASGFKAAIANAAKPRKAPAAGEVSEEDLFGVMPTYSTADVQKMMRFKTYRARIRFLDVWTVVGAILLTAVVIYLMHILSTPVSIVAWTVVFVFCLRGVVAKFNKMGMSRLLATTLAYVLMVIVLVLLGFLLFSPMFGVNNQFSDLFKSLPEYIHSITGMMNDLYNRFSPYLEDETIHQILVQAQSSVSSWAGSLASQSASSIVSIGTGVANTLMAIGFALVIAFWILLQLPAIGRETKRLINPRFHNDAEFIHMTFTTILGGYIKGTLLQCAVIGIVCGIAYAILGIPNSIALGGITGLLNIIPIVGPWLGGIAAAVVALFKSPMTALIAVIITIIVQQFVYTFVSPRIMASSCNVHPVITLLALMAGSAIGGAMDGLVGSLVGMLASIPFAAVAKSMFVYYFEKRTGRRIVYEDGVFFQGSPDEMYGSVNPLKDATAPEHNPNDTRTPEEIATEEKIENARTALEREVKRLTEDAEHKLRH